MSNKKKIIIGILFAFVLLEALIYFLFVNKYYIVTFKENGKTIEEKVKKGQLVKERVIQDKNFIGWFDEDTDLEFDFSTKIEKNITLIAKYGEGYTITFDSDGGDHVASVKVLVGKKTIAPEEPKRKGYKFVGWEWNGKEYTFGEALIEDITLKAIWEESDEKVTVTFDSKGGSAIEKVEVVINHPVSKPDDPYRRGYEFVEWQLNNQAYDFSKEVLEDITLTAVWKEKPKYKVVFMSDGVEVHSLTVIRGEKITTMPNNPSKNGHVFVGWFSGNNQVNADTRIYSNTTIHAGFITTDRSNLNNAITYIQSLHPTMETGGSLTANVEALGCRVTPKNLPATIDRVGTDTSVNVSFDITCGNEAGSAQTSVVIKKSPYTYTKTANSNMLNYNVTVNGGNWIGDAKLFLGNEGSFHVSSRIAVVENGKVQNNPTFKLRFNNDPNTLYTVSFGG